MLLVRQRACLFCRGPSGRLGKAQCHPPARRCSSAFRRCPACRFRAPSLHVATSEPCHQRNRWTRHRRYVSVQGVRKRRRTHGDADHVCCTGDERIAGVSPAGRDSRFDGIYRHGGDLVRHRSRGPRTARVLFSSTWFVQQRNHVRLHRGSGSGRRTGVGQNGVQRRPCEWLRRNADSYRLRHHCHLPDRKAGGRI